MEPVLSENVHQLKVPRKMRGKKSKPPEVLDNLVELPLPEGDITPQQLLAKLSRYAWVDRVVILIPSEDPEAGEVVHVTSNNLENQEILWLLEKAKLTTMGVI